ncbi:MAG: 4Fe-4S dicluster domain-containing protein [Clostridiales bacterium]|nr:4Fe-4S dicluster domain-containing protein [Clostridiales bacterium]
MITSKFQDKTLSLLGFGTMRLPLAKDGSIDEAQVAEMTDYALKQGVNYFDTAYPYHDGKSEVVMGKVLNQYPRDSWYLATKYPGHQISSSYDPAAIFEEQLKKCGVDYFDFYLLHNVYENSMDVYLDPKWGILDYFKEQKRLGRIKHLGFSSHGRAETLKAFLDICGDDMEFCQIQLNYLDWTLQDAKAKYELLTERNIPVWVMEPLRGGKLAALEGDAAVKLQAAAQAAGAPGRTDAEWSFRFLQSLPNVKMVLSGMSNLTQMQQNIATFEARAPLSDAERSALLDVAEGLKKGVPCTACRYCTAGCPMELDIPLLLSVYNDVLYAPSLINVIGLEALPDEKRPAACIGCGKCAKICPQSIDIPGALKNFAEILSKMPTWAEISRQREEAAKRNAAAAK